MTTSDFTRCGQQQPDTAQSGLGPRLGTGSVDDGDHDQGAAAQPGGGVGGQAAHQALHRPRAPAPRRRRPAPPFPDRSQIYLEPQHKHPNPKEAFEEAGLGFSRRSGGAPGRQPEAPGEPASDTRLRCDQERGQHRARGGGARGRPGPGSRAPAAHGAAAPARSGPGRRRDMGARPAAPVRPAPEVAQVGDCERGGGRHGQAAGRAWPGGGAPTLGPSPAAAACNPGLPSMHCVARCWY